MERVHMLLHACNKVACMDLQTVAAASSTTINHRQMQPSYRLVCRTRSRCVVWFAHSMRPPSREMTDIPNEIFRTFLWIETDRTGERCRVSSAHGCLLPNGSNQSTNVLKFYRSFPLPRGIKRDDIWIPRSLHSIDFCYRSWSCFFFVLKIVRRWNWCFLPSAKLATVITDWAGLSMLYFYSLSFIAGVLLKRL